ncbi:hypothetical protein V8J88_05480 [Massilia sp. W12]|uniref:hypothetical protein n=1 Tax=Massilia sp. W12 TaxID=3126507 RepID=UPI0030CE4539
MENVNFDFHIETGVEWNSACCRMQLLLSDAKWKIGEIESSVLCRLMLASVNFFLETIKKQMDYSEIYQNMTSSLPANKVIEGLYSAQWEDEEFSCGSVIFTKEIAITLNALPMTVETFDGEIAYIIYSRDTESGRLIWRDYDSRSINECLIDFNQYISMWEEVRVKLESKALI